MTELDTSSPFIRALSGSPVSGPAVGVFAIPGRANPLGKPATPFAARHMFTTSRSVSPAEQSAPEAVEVDPFYVTRRAARHRIHNGVVY